MDRTVVSESSFVEADNHTYHSKDKSTLERLNLACDIINSIFNSSPTSKVDRTIIAARKHAKSL